MVLREGHICPRGRISIYQYISSVPVHLPNTKGKEPKNDNYVNGAIFVDHAPSYLHIQNQVGLTPVKTFWGEHAAQFGVKLEGFLEDNVPFV